MLKNLNTSASKRFKSKLAQNNSNLFAMKGGRCRSHIGGQKLTNIELEKQVLSWIHERCANMLQVRRKLVMFKAKSTYDEKCGNNEVMKDAFIASNGWLVKFMSCNNLSL